MEWQPKKGDRVMLSDERWQQHVERGYNVGRRGGVVVAIRDRDYGAYASVRWDGVKQTDSVPLNELCPDDPTKHMPSVKAARAHAKAVAAEKAKRELFLRLKAKYEPEGVDAAGEQGTAKP